jgi:glutathione synthase/RimK-type ligase-like ATP-grasp enzyme
MKYLILDKRQRIIGGDTYASTRLKEELDKENIPSDIAYYDQLEFMFLNSSTQILVNGIDIKEYSNIIFRGHSLHDEKEYQYKRYIIDYIEQYNQNNPEKKVLIQNLKAIKNFQYYNKVAISLLCSKYNLPYFNTYYKVNGNYKTEKKMLDQYPVIAKEYAGANRIENGKIKKNVFKIENDSDLDKIDNPKNYFIQEYSDKGEDYRLFVKKGQVIGGWKRTATQGFMTVSKGKYELYNNPPIEMSQIAEKVATVLEADLIAVDFMYMNDKPLLQEFSFNPGFKAYETKIQGEKLNIAKEIISTF